MVHERLGETLKFKKERTCPKCNLIVPQSCVVCPQDGTVLESNPLGQGLSERFQLLSVIGSGGMSVIYKAQHLCLNKVMAIKMLHGYLMNEDSMVRFQQEAWAATKLDHANIIRVHDFGISEHGQPYMVMDYLEGKTLEEILREQKCLHYQQSLPIFLQICAAMGHAHKAGVLHRDLKPSNIMVMGCAEELMVKVVDFGIAKLMDSPSNLTRTGDFMGSPPYASPEQCCGKPMDVRSDVYSIGCIMYEALTGLQAAPGNSILEILHRQINEEPVSIKVARPDLHLPNSLAAVVARSLAKDPKARYQTVEALRKDLQKVSLSKGFVRMPVNLSDSRSSASSARQARIRPALILLSATLVCLATAAVPVWSIVRPLFLHDRLIRCSCVSNDRQSIDDQFLGDCLSFDMKFENNALNLCQSRITDQSGARLDRWKSLQSLWLEDCRITDKTVASLGRITALRVLSLRRCPRISDQGIAYLLPLRNLEELALSSTAISDLSMDVLVQLPNLRRLTLSETKITGEGLKKLRRLPLTLLHLRGSSSHQMSIRDEDLQAIGKIASLTELTLRNDGVTANGIRYLKDLKSLQILDLGGTDINDDAIAYLIALPDLASLIADHTQLDDRCLDSLLKMPALTYLNLEHTNITDTTLVGLARLKQLQLLRIAECPSITTAAVERLRAELPNCRIEGK